MPPKFSYKDIVRFFKNIWYFRKELYHFRWYDYHYMLQMMRKSLEIMAKNVEEKGWEVDSSRLKKVAKMKRAIEIIKNFDGIDHIELAEKELGELRKYEMKFVPLETDPTLFEMVTDESEEDKQHNKKVYARAREIEQEEWNELWEIFKGQDIKKYKPKKQDWDDWFDGSGMNNWWD